LWNLQDPALLSYPLTGHVQAVYGLTVSAAGHWLAAALIPASVDGSATPAGEQEFSVGAAGLWDLSHPAAPPRLLSKQYSPAAISADERSLVALGGSDTAVQWELDGPNPGAQSHMAAMNIALDQATSLALSPDGHWLITTEGFNSPTQVTNLNLDELMAVACQTAGRNLTLDEWQQALGDVPYRKTCADLPSGEATPSPTPPGGTPHLATPTSTATP
jgi:hypothetical protein